MTHRPPEEQLRADLFSALLCVLLVGTIITLACLV